MEICVVRDLNILMGYAEDWNEILKLCDNKNYFLTLDWIKSWWQFFGEGHCLYAVIAKEGDVVLGFVPLMREKKKLYTEYRFVTYPRGIRAGMLIRPGYEQEVVSRTVKHLRSIKDGVFYLNGLIKGDPFYHALMDSLENTRKNITTQVYPYLVFDGISEDAYFKKIKSHQEIKRVFSLERKLDSLLPIRFVKAAPEEVDSIFPLHEKRWSQKNDNNGFGKGIARQFYTYLAGPGNPNSPQIPSSFETSVYLLMAGQKLIGFAYEFVCNGHVSLCRLAHENDFSDFKPGLIVVKHTLSTCFTRKFDSFDVSTGEERYKRLFMDKQSDVCQILFGADSGHSRWVLSLAILRISIRETLKKNKMILHFKRVTLGHIKYVLSGAPIKCFFDKAKVLFTNQNLFTYLSIALKKLWIKISHKAPYRLYVASNSVAADITNMGAVTLRSVALDEMDLLLKFTTLPANRIVRRFKVGERCCLLIDGDKVVGYAWISKAQIDQKNNVIWKGEDVFDRCIYDVHLFGRFDSEQVRDILQCLAKGAISTTDIRNGKVYLLASAADKKLFRIAEKMFCAAESEEGPV